jgi:hypothetical protein
MRPLSVKKSESVVCGWKLKVEGLRRHRLDSCLAPKVRNSYVSLGQRPKEIVGQWKNKR